MEIDEKLSGLTMNAQAWVSRLEHKDSVYNDAFHNVFYKVEGRVFDEMLQSFLKVNVTFHDKESANLYFDLVKKNHINSILKLVELTNRELRFYE